MLFHSSRWKTCDSSSTGGGTEEMCSNLTRPEARLTSWIHILPFQPSHDTNFAASLAPSNNTFSHTQHNPPPKTYPVGFRTPHEQPSLASSVAHCTSLRKHMDIKIREENSYTLEHQSNARSRNINYEENKISQKLQNN